MLGCTGKSGDSTTQQDTSQVEDVNDNKMEADDKVEDEGGGAFDPTAAARQETETQLKNFLEEFEAKKNTLLRLQYAIQNEYDGTTTTYYYTEKTLTYIQQSQSAEGGYEEKILTKIDGNTKTTVSYANNPSGHSNYDLEGYFSFTRNGEETAYSINSKNDIWTVIGETEVKQFTFDDPTGHVDVVRKNKSQFVLTDGVGTYVFFTERKKVNSEYGEVEITKSYQVDKGLFEMPGMF